ncbi:MAG: alpha/beta fold hydrolase [Chloroflexota bacterium]
MTLSKRSIILLTIGLIIIVISAFFGFLFWQAWSVVNVPNRNYTETPEDFGITIYEEFALITDDNTVIRGWYVPPTRDDGATIMFLHGHTGNRLDLMSEALEFYIRGYGIALFDFRGRGQSDDAPVTMGVNEVLDAGIVLDYLMEQPDVNPERIGVYGFSMGAATAIMLAAERSDIRVVVANASYTSFFDLVADRTTGLFGLPPVIIPEFVVSMTNRLAGVDLNEASPIDSMPSITQPIVFIHGSVDNVIDDPHSEELFDLAPFPKLYYRVFAGGHDDSYENDPEMYVDIVVQFVERHLTN